MNLFNKKFGFTLSEVLVTLGLIGVVSALTIPNIAYNYRAKVLEEQYRSTYSEIRQIGSMMNYEYGDVGTYANKTNFSTWQKEFMSRINGGNNLLNGITHENITSKLREIYKNAGASEGPYQFHYDDSEGKKGQRQQRGIICDNGAIWTDSKGRLWTFNSESRIICVDTNGTANPNQLNIDIFAFIPMSAAQVAKWIYNDADNPNNYSGSIIPCDLDYITTNGLSNNTESSVKNTEKQPVFVACPFNEPIENIAKEGKSARNKPVTKADNYWKTYIDYK